MMGFIKKVFDSRTYFADKLDVVIEKFIKDREKVHEVEFCKIVNDYGIFMLDGSAVKDKDLIEDVMRLIPYFDDKDFYNKMEKFEAWSKENNLDIVRFKEFAFKAASNKEKLDSFNL